MAAYARRLVLILLLACGPAKAGISLIPTVVTTPEIIAQGTIALANPTCLDWCMTGVCTWLKCALFACSVETSPRYKHNNPDLVVTVYDELGSDPWVEMNLLYGVLQIGLAEVILGWLSPVGLIGGGHQTEGASSPDLEDKSLRFKEASAYGHPMASLSNFASGMALCPSEATPYLSYFQSGADAAEWRFGFLEMLYLPYLVPGIRTIGKLGFLQQWGAVWPRTGFVMQKDDPKAGAVVAQRVGNIVTGDGGIHVRVPLAGNGYSWTVLPGELIENVSLTGVWRMIKPLPDPVCDVFGANDVYSPLPWSTLRSSDDNGYAYELWRRYECCEAKGSLLYVVPAYVCI